MLARERLRCGAPGVRGFRSALPARVILGLWGLLVWGAPAGDAAEPGAPPQAAETLIREWTFDRDGDPQGWQANGHLRDVTVANGVWSARAIGSDPILELRPRLEFKASPWQVIEVRLRADRDGTAEFFWSGTAQGRYGGFSQDKTTRFPVRGDGTMRTYRLMPGWHPEGRIVRLRFDVYDGAQFAIDHIRIRELAMPQAAERPQFDFRQDSQGWQVVEETDMRLLLAPPMRVEAARNSWVSLQMSLASGTGDAAGQSRATLIFATEAEPGLHRFTFPVDADGRDHIYNLDLLDAAHWRGSVIALGLRAPDGAALPQLRWLKVGDQPAGPAQLVIRSLTIEEALPRAGRPVTLTAVLANTGGETATNVRATLTLSGARAMTPAELAVDRLGFDEEAVRSWTIQAEAPGPKEFRLRLTGSGTAAVEATARAQFTPPPSIAAAGYVPEPAPVRGPFEVGAYYFPGWKSAGQWHPIRGFPERRPMLGWYREGDPEVADWHIKWAVEHGITFFAYDWYWSQGARQLEHGLHDGYFKARYRHLLKFCLLWANHNAPHTSSHDDCLAVTRHWIEHYFRRPEHLTVGGKPVMIIFSPHRLTEDLGSDGVHRAFDAMRAECRRAGLPGLHLVACVSDAGQARQAAREGYDAITAYNWPHLGMEGNGPFAPFAGLLDGYRRHWAHLAEQSPIPLSPLPVCGGWDSRPWHGENNLVRFGRTPALFRQHLEDAKAVLIKGGPRRTNGPALVLVEAWNEWGEGSYIEPHQEFGFGYLDAIRRVFTEAPDDHVDLAPADVGLGPYDVLVPAVQTAWGFETDDNGWGNTMDLTDVQAAGGVLAARSTGNDPAFFGPPLQAPAARFASVAVRMRLSPITVGAIQDSAQLFWRTRRLAESEATSARFPVTVDGQWHDYRISVAQNPRWRGVITRLRLDPCNRSGVRIELDSIRLGD